MRRRVSWDERQGDLFGASAPKQVAEKRLSQSKSPVPEKPTPQPVSLVSLAQRSSRVELDDMVNELGDEELAYLITRGVRSLKRRLMRAGQGGSRRASDRGRQSPLDRALRDIATELSAFDESGADW